MLIEPFEENIHIELMEALLKVGQNKSAMNHYDYALNMLEKEFDAKPSQRFTSYIKKIQNNSSRKSDLDISAIKKNLEEEPVAGAMYCSLEYFKFLFNIQKRKSQRNNQNDYLCIITINRNEESYNESNELNKGISDVVSSLGRSLRKGDVFTSWNENQILIMLHDVSKSGIETIENRLLYNLVKLTKISRNEISMIFQPLLLEDTVL